MPDTQYIPPLIIPEVVFFNHLKTILKMIRDDYNDNLSDTTKTILYKTFYQSGALEKFSFYEQLVKILITKKDNPRTFDFSLGFNMEKSTIPHLHITLPNENSSGNGIGLDEGQYDEIFDDEAQAYHKIYTRRFDSQYNFTITSDNMNEVIVLYHFMRTIFIQMIDSMNQFGIEKIQISGRDIQLNSSLAPNVFTRNIALSFSYEVSVQDLPAIDFITKLIFEMDPPTISDSEVDESQSLILES